MNKIGILYHPHKQAAKLLGAEVGDWLRDQGRETWMAPGHDGRLPAQGKITKEIPDTDLLVILGGDGSTLRAARAAAPFGIPIFGINMGRVGFLSEANPDNWQPRLDQVLNGEGWIEERLMLKACLQRQGQTLVTFVALNDVVVGRGTKARVLRLHLSVDQDPVTTYTADGLIVATPTGSTAYAMAAGGPLLPPQLSNFLTIPVAPHLSLDRAVILHEDAVVSIEIEMDHEATVAADGQKTTYLESGDQVLVEKHEDRTRFVRVGRPSYFYHRLMERLGFWHPKGLN